MRATTDERPPDRAGRSYYGLVGATLSSINDSKAIALVIAFSAVLIGPMALWGIPEGGDLANHYRFAIPFYESIQKGNLYPGWLAESNDGYGDARFRFYPPGLYYMFALFKPLAGWYWSSIISFAVFTALGCLGVYFWTRSFLAPPVATLAAVLYAVAPYHLNELYQASLLSEYAASGVLPFLFAFIDRVCERQRFHDVAGLAAAYALLLLMNLPLAVIGSLSALVFTLVRVTGKGAFKIDLKLATGVILGLTASAFFWVRMLQELPLIKGSGVNASSYYDYRLNFVFSSSALTNRNTWFANLLALVTIGFLLPAVVLFRKGNGSKRHIAMVVVTIFAFLMALPLSKPLWDLIPKLAEVQFPWRWFAVVSLTGSVLLASSLSTWIDLFKKQIRPLYLVPVVAFAFSLLFVLTQVVWDSDYMSKAEFDSFLPKVRGAVSFKDWLPVEAAKLTELPRMTEEVEVESRNTSVVAWEPEFRSFNVEVGPATDAKLRTFYYPNWVARAEGASLPVKPGSGGVILISIPERPVTVELFFRESAHVRAAYWVSLGGWMVIGILCLAGLKKARTQLTI